MNKIIDPDGITCCPQCGHEFTVGGRAELMKVADIVSESLNEIAVQCLKSSLCLESIFRKRETHERTGE